MWFRFPRMGEAYVDTIIRYTQEVSLWFEEDQVSEIVFRFDVAHVHNHLITLTFFRPFSSRPLLASNASDARKCFSSQVNSQRNARHTFPEQHKVLSEMHVMLWRSRVGTLQRQVWNCNCLFPRRLGLSSIMRSTLLSSRSTHFVISHVSHSRDFRRA